MGDQGLAGALTGLEDNRTTGRFLDQTYEMVVRDVAEGDDPVEGARALLAETPYLVIDAPASALLAIADAPEAAGALLFNVGAGDDNKLGTEIYITVDNGDETAIHTSCSQAIGVNSIFGDFTVTAGASKNGGPLDELDATCSVGGPI